MGAWDFGACKKSPRKNNPLALVRAQQRVQALEISAGRALRHRLALRAIGGGFAEVHIRDQQRFLLWPIDRFICQQQQRNPANIKRQLLFHISALMLLQPKRKFGLRDFRLPILGYSLTALRWRRDRG